MAQPNFQLMWDSYPDHEQFPTLSALHAFIGGQVDKATTSPGFGPTGNTCAMRMSRALNYGSMPISGRLASSLNLHTLTGADRKLYLFRVRELRTYLSNAIGVSPIRVKKDFPTAFERKRGIVAFTVSGWSDASGHVALWNGSEFRDDHDDFRFLRDYPETPIIEPRTVEMTLWPL